MKRTHSDSVGRQRDRSGIALMIAIITVVVATGLILGLTRQMISRTRQAERRLWTLQAEVVADAVEAGLRRTLRSDSEVSVESWSPALPGPSGPAGKVTITRGGSSEHPTFHVEVRVPADTDAPAIAIRDLAE